MVAIELNTCLFMEEVQKHESLYNTFSKDYKNKYVRVNYWKKIGENFAISPEQAENKNTKTSERRKTANKTKYIVVSPALQFTVAIFKLNGFAPKIVVRTMPFTCITARMRQLRRSRRSSGFHIIVAIAQWSGSSEQILGRLGRLGRLYGNQA